MEFEFDPPKSESNRQKHGIDFVEAQALWRDPKRLESRVNFPHEPRSALVAQYGGRTWTAVFTYRSQAIRLISVRRSRPQEIAQYERR